MATARTTVDRDTQCCVLQCSPAVHLKRYNSSCDAVCAIHSALCAAYIVPCGPMVWSSIGPLWSNGPDPQVVSWSRSDSSRDALCASYIVPCGPMVWSSIDPLWSNGPGPQAVQWSGSDSSVGALCAPRVLYWFSFKLGGAQAEPLDSFVAQSASGKDR